MAVARSKIDRADRHDSGEAIVAVAGKLCKLFDRRHGVGGQLFLLRGQPIDSLGQLEAAKKSAKADVAGLLRRVARPPGTINQHKNCVGSRFSKRLLKRVQRASKIEKSCQRSGVGAISSRHR